MTNVSAYEPFLCKIRMQAEYKTSGGPKLGMMQSFKKMFSEEGVRGLYRVRHHIESIVYNYLTYSIIFIISHYCINIVSICYQNKLC